MKENKCNVETGLLYTDSIQQINLHSNKDLSIYSSLFHTDVLPLGIEKEMTVQAFVRFHPHWILQKEGRPLLYVGIIWIVLCGIYVFVWIYQRKSKKWPVVDNEIENVEIVEVLENAIGEKAQEEVGKQEINEESGDILENQLCEEVEKEIKKDVKQEISNKVKNHEGIEMLKNEPYEEARKDIKQEFEQKIEKDTVVQIGKYTYDKEHGVLIFEKEKSTIRKTQEYIVLNSLLSAPDYYCTEEDLLKALNKREEFIGELRSVISRLRKCFVHDTSIQIILEDNGYRFDINSDTTVAENTANEPATTNEDILEPDVNKE